MTARPRIPSRKIRYSMVGIGIAIILVFPLDYLLLRGEQVASASVRLSHDEADSIPIVDVGEPHLLEILTRRNTKRARRRIAYRLIAPSGEVILEANELRSRKRRYERFTPEEAGTYEFEARDRGLFETKRQRGGTGDDRRPSIDPMATLVLMRVLA